MKLQNLLQFLSIYLVFIYFEGSQCYPQERFVVTTSRTPSNLDHASSIIPQPAPKIVDVDIRSDIQFRYAKTVVKTYIKNPSTLSSQEVEFNMVLPSIAFISNFTIQIVGEEKVYVSKVAKKEDAKQYYDKAVEGGQSAGIVDVDTRDANKITIKSNLEAASKLLFTLTYEELLERHNSKYEHIIHVNPGQIVKNFNVDVYINESLPLTNLHVPELKTDANEITSMLKENDIAKIERNMDGHPNRAHVQFHPTPDTQRQMGKESKREETGMVGQFIVQYDVNRQHQGNEIQVLDGYFVHFFAPDQLEVMPRHVVFVLDVSGSMSGTKLTQTKDAMVTILDDLSERDYFNILTFSDGVYHWSPEQNQVSEEIAGVEPTKPTYRGTESLRKEALKYVLDLEIIGGTNINDALQEALNVVEKVHVSEVFSYNVKPVIIFLTDGQAGVTKNVLNRIQEQKIPIYGLAFGHGADFNLMKDISTRSGGFARKIYEASDAAIQLEDFYQEIASPLLKNVTFDYVGNSFQNKTNKTFNTFFKGGEFMTAGKFDSNLEDDEIEIVVRGKGKSSDYETIIRRCQSSSSVLEDNLNVDHSRIKKSHNITSHDPCIPWTEPSNLTRAPKESKSDAENFIERLWAFLTIRNLLDDTRVNENGNNEVGSKHENLGTNSNEEKALELALKYNFVTKLTSLYVVKPEDENLNGKNNSLRTTINPVPISLTPNKAYGAASYGAPFASYIQSYSASHSTAYAPPKIAYSAAKPSYSAPSYKRVNSYASSSSPLRPSPMGYSSSSSVADASSSGGVAQAALSGVRRIIANIGGGRFKSKRRRTRPRPFRLNKVQPLSLPVSISSANFQTNFTNNDSTSYRNPTTTTTTEVSTTTTDYSSCSLTLFSKTYLRGQKLVLTPQNNYRVLDLSQLLFNNKLASLEVDGPCCWEIYEGPKFSGQSKIFSQGEYKSSTDIGSALIKEASSVLMTTCNKIKNIY